MRNIFFPHYLSGEPQLVLRAGFVRSCVDRLPAFYCLCVWGVELKLAYENIK